eukprot:gb/GEZN01004702.1/.p1 GENE.gb/GEZN01004702.1/~~gb/GEZN01004702.1/.p1  ORF type:complete len:600 (-),score=98.33 gb/GEZN01004702.1/:13-1812(-)
MSQLRSLAQHGVDIAAAAGRYLPKHPFPMKTTFRNCFLVNFSMEPATLQRVLPFGLRPDVYQGRAFLSVVIADLEAMRPGFVPRACGTTFTQVVHRAIVRAPNGERGVYFVRSDANNVAMSLAGNMFSNFHFNLASTVWMGKDQFLPPAGPGSLDSDPTFLSTSRVLPPASGWLPDLKTFTGGGAGVHGNDAKIAAEGKAAGTVHFMLEPWLWGRERAAIHASYDMATACLEMPNTSAFAGNSVREAQKYFVELYTAFASWPQWDYWSAVRIDRTRWNLVSVEHSGQPEYQFMQGSSIFAPGSCQLDSVFYVHDLDYHWKVVEKNPFELPLTHPVFGPPDSEPSARTSRPIFPSCGGSSTAASFPSSSSSPSAADLPPSSSDSSPEPSLPSPRPSPSSSPLVRESAASLNSPTGSSLPSCPSSPLPSSQSPFFSSACALDPSPPPPLGSDLLSASPQHLSPNTTTVFYDGACPLCSKEIAYYKRLAGSHSSPLRFFDLSAHNDTGPLGAAFGISMEQALSAMFVVDKNRRLHQGAYAFVAMWQDLPTGPWKWLGRGLSILPGAVPVAQMMYFWWARHRTRLTGGGAKRQREIGASCRLP